jgi:hypothetical protein
MLESAGTTATAVTESKGTPAAEGKISTEGNSNESRDTGLAGKPATAECPLLI